LWAIAVGTFLMLLTFRLRRSRNYVQKIADDVAQGRQFSDSEKARQQTAFGARLALWWGTGLGLVMVGLGIASLITGLIH
jgi:hypothetical protein